MEHMIRKKGYAKINLALDVLRRLPNGYHEVRMIMQQIGLADDVYLGKTQECGRPEEMNYDGIYLTTNCPELPSDKQNLAYRAAKLFKDTYGVEEEVTIHIDKHIPLGAGLAGGSADAAAVLLGMKELFGKKISPEELCQMGTWLGADVPFCITGGAALAEGIGEKLTPVRSLSERCVILLCKPDFSISTKETYAKYSKRLEEMKEKKGPQIDRIRDWLEEGEMPSPAWQESMVNVLEYISLQEHPQIGKIKEEMAGYQPEAVLMSGSGPTVFAVFSDGEKAADAYESMKKRYEQTYIVRPREPEE